MELDCGFRKLTSTFFPLLDGGHRIAAEKKPRSAPMLMNRSSLSVAQHTNFRAYPLRNALQESSVRATPPPLRPEGTVPAETTESLAIKKAPPPRSAVGFLLMDSALNSISFNVEATQI